MNKSTLAKAFSNGEFEKVYPKLAEDVVWTVIEESEYVGKNAVVNNCDQVARYFSSVKTVFTTLNVIADEHKVAVNGTAEFWRDDVLVSFVSACDVYEFNDRGQICKITSYCIQKNK